MLNCSITQLHIEKFLAHLSDQGHPSKYM